VTPWFFAFSMLSNIFRILYNYLHSLLPNSQNGSF